MTLTCNALVLNSWKVWSNSSLPLLQDYSLTKIGSKNVSKKKKKCKEQFLAWNVVYLQLWYRVTFMWYIVVFFKNMNTIFCFVCFFFIILIWINPIWRKKKNENDTENPKKKKKKKKKSYI